MYKIFKFLVVNVLFFAWHLIFALLLAAAQPFGLFNNNTLAAFTLPGGEKSRTLYYHPPTLEKLKIYESSTHHSSLIAVGSEIAKILI
jgi:hypothetical protein